MSIEERLYELAQQYREQYGAAALGQAGPLVAHLSSMAPDLHLEVRALAAAIAAGAGARITGAPNSEREAASIATEIATAQKLPMASVTTGVAVARRLGGTPVAAAAPAVAGGWAGDSVIAGASAPPAYAPQLAPTPSFAPQPIPPAAAQPPFYQNKWVLGGIGAVALLLGYQQMVAQPSTPPAQTGVAGPAMPQSPQTPVQPTVPGPPTAQPPEAPFNPDAPQPTTGSGAAPTQFPALAAPNGTLPTLPVQPQGQGFLIGFTINGATGLVTLPPGGWDKGQGALMLTRSPQSQQPDSMGSGAFQRLQSGSNPVRVAQIQWQQDNVGIGPVCVAFMGNGGQDVALKGSRMCLMDGPCSRPLGCGQVP